MQLVWGRPWPRLGSRVTCFSGLSRTTEIERPQPQWRFLPSTMKNQENLKPAQADQTVILIAEDEALVANIVRIILEKHGYFILTASDGENALFISRQY